MVIARQSSDFPGLLLRDCSKFSAFYFNNHFLPGSRQKAEGNWGTLRHFQNVDRVLGVGQGTTERAWPCLHCITSGQARFSVTCCIPFQ